MRKWMILIFCATLLWSCTSDYEIEKEIEGAPYDYHVTANKLYTEYINNEVAADTKYEYKILQVRGMVATVRKDLLDGMYIMVVGVDFVEQIQCYFSDIHADKLGKLTSYEWITVKGKCTGMVSGIVVLHGCILRE